MTDEGTVLNEIDMRDTRKVAALDIGSNSFHLVVARIVADSVQILHRVKQKVRLASGLENDVLSEEAMTRGLDSLRTIAESLKGFEPDSVRIVATYTLRKASNARQFIARAKQIFPYPVEVISGNEEARLIYSGVAHTSHADGRRLVIDIGGGSTEFVIGEGFNPLLCRSLEMGCVSYTSRFFATGEITKKAFNRAITAAQQSLEMVERRYVSMGWEICIGTSGTIKTVMALCQQDPNKDAPITLDQLLHLMGSFIKQGHAHKLTFDSLSDERQPVISAGLAILIAIFKSLNIDEMNFSPAALREGVLYQMSASLEHESIRGRTAQSLAARYDVDTEQAALVHNVAIKLFDTCKDQWQLIHNDLRTMLAWASLLHEVGIQINSKGQQRHGAYIIANVDMPGFNQEQQVLLSTLIRFQRKKVKPEEIPEFEQYSSASVIRLIVILRLSVLLNIKRQPNFLSDFDLFVMDNDVSLKFAKNWLDNKPIFEADLEQECLYLSDLGIRLVFA